MIIGIFDINILQKNKFSPAENARQRDKQNMFNI